MDTEDVQTVQQEMTLDLTCDEFNITLVRMALASRFGVDVALITLTDPCATRRVRARALQSASGLSFTVTIATSAIAADGSTVSAEASDLLAAVQGVDDSTLARSR